MSTAPISFRGCEEIVYDAKGKFLPALEGKQIGRYRCLPSMLDDQIDKAVYGLYQLTDSEIEEVEKVIAGLVPP